MASSIFHKKDKSRRILPPYRKENDSYVIDLKLKALNQLYNSLDPAPFHERDLDNAAADYICEAVKELRTHQNVKFLIQSQEELTVMEKDQMRDAIHYYFSYRARTCRGELHRELKIGRTSMLVGLLFMGFYFEVSSLLSNIPGTFQSVLRKGLLIVGWVAMWKPLDIFLYRWRPILADIRLYEKIANLPIEIS